MYEEQLVKVWAQRNKFTVHLLNEEKKVTLSFKTRSGKDLYVLRGTLPVYATVTATKPVSIDQDPVSLEVLSEMFMKLYGGESLYYYTSNGKAQYATSVPCISPQPYDYSNQIKHE